MEAQPERNNYCIAELNDRITGIGSGARSKRLF